MKLSELFIPTLCPSPTFSGTFFTNRHPDTKVLQLRAHWGGEKVGKCCVCVWRGSWSIGLRKMIDHVPSVKAELKIPLPTHVTRVKGKYSIR